MDVLGLLILLGAGWLVGVGLLTWHTTWMLMHPPRRRGAYAIARNLPSTPAEVPIADSARSLEYSEWWLTGQAGGELPVWDISGLDPAGPIVIVTHGWGDSRVVMLSRAAALVRAARRVILWDLPGHGEASRAARFTLGHREALLLQELVATVRRSDGATPIVLYGFSLGAGISIAAAASDADSREPVIAGVIAEAPYRGPIKPARQVMRRMGMPYRLNLPLAMIVLGIRFGQGAAWARPDGGDGFDRRRLASRVRVPMLVLHGSADEICPIEDSRAIAEAAPSAGEGGGDARSALLREIPGASHTDMWTEPAHLEACWSAVASFLLRFRGPGA
ncbi:MAG: alpha/beta hydrolase [Phycisphaerales bacterium]